MVKIGIDFISGWDYTGIMSDETRSWINSLNLKEAQAALAMAEINHDAMKPEFRPTMAQTIDFLRDRVRRLRWTQDRINRIQGVAR